MALSVIFVSSEASPFSKTGGLGDVAGALPAALAEQGCDVALFLPLYRETLEKGLEVTDTGLEVVVPLGRRMIRAGVWRAGTGAVKTFFIRCDEYFDRSFLYGTPERDYFDNLERFTLFSRAVLEALCAMRLRPDVVHANDWQTGLLPLYIKNLYRADAVLGRTATLFTVHNSAFQGLFPADNFDILGISHRLFTPSGIEFWGSISLLKAGLVFADVLTTVSPGYCRELKTARCGYGLEGLYKARGSDLFGVINGVDYNEWDPAADPLIPARYSPEDMSGKEVCRRALLNEFGLQDPGRGPVAGMVTRLTPQKGIDLVIRAMDGLVGAGISLAIVGSGDSRTVARLGRACEKHPGRAALKTGFDNRLAHLLEAGSDIFLMPSKFEPCGLNQIYSQKYGTIPVVRATGGLDDTVRDYGAEPRPTGFKFRRYSAKALVKAVRRAVEVFRDGKEWRELQLRAMSEDFSWSRSAKRYLELYGLAMKKTALPPGTEKNKDIWGRRPRRG
jgi:starch synthase